MPEINDALAAAAAVGIDDPDPYTTALLEPMRAWVRQYVGDTAASSGDPETDQGARAILGWAWGPAHPVTIVGAEGRPATTPAAAARKLGRQAVQVLRATPQGRAAESAAEAVRQIVDLVGARDVLVSQVPGGGDLLGYGAVVRVAASLAKGARHLLGLATKSAKSAGLKLRESARAVSDRTISAMHGSTKLPPGPATGAELRAGIKAASSAAKGDAAARWARMGRVASAVGKGAGLVGLYAAGSSVVNAVGGVAEGARAGGRAVGKAIPTLIIVGAGLWALSRRGKAR